MEILGQTLWQRSLASKNLLFPGTHILPAELFMSYLHHFRSILLGTKGFDVPRLSEKLDRLDTAKTFEPLEPVRETDIQVLV